MTIRANWNTGDSFTSTDANEIAAQVNANTEDAATAVANAAAALAAVQDLDPSEVGSAVVSAQTEQEARDVLNIPGTYNLVSVKDYGAVGDGVTDDTDAIEAAYVASVGKIYFPPGVYIYNGTGMSGGWPTVVGEGFASTRIILGADSYLLNIDTQIGALYVRGLKTEGGKGIIRYNWTGSNVIRKYAVQDCEFNYYTECAIASDGADMPYWLIKNCYFESANTTGTIGVALGGGTDQVVIDSCSFVKNRIHLRVKGGNNLQVTNCDFIQFSAVNSSGPRVAVWVVPNTTTNSGQGLVIRNSKFGNENLVAGDYRILYADADGGATNGVKMPVLNADSTGYVYGHLITGCFFGVIGSASNPIVYSTTPNVRGIHITDCYDDGAPYYLEFRTPPTVPNSASTLNVFGPIAGPGLSASVAMTRISNGVGVGYLNDPAGTSGDSSVVRGSGASAAYSNRFAYAAPDFNPSGSCTVGAAEADAFGGTNASTYTFSSGTAYVYAGLSAMTPDVPLFVEFDLKNPDDGNAISHIGVVIWDHAANYHFARRVEVPSVAQGWVSYRYHFTPRTAGSTLRAYFGPAPGLTSGTVTVGRPRFYHGNAAQLGGFRPAIAAEATDAATTQTLANDLRAKLIDLGIIEAT